jgi:hypothetical protein
MAQLPGADGFGGSFETRGAAQRLRLVRQFPRERSVGTAEMAESRSLLIDGPAQLQVVDNALRRE